MANLQSKYEEDVHINGHTSVWGSYFHRGAFRWGYADDHSLMRNTYCTGAAGRAANDEANELAAKTVAAAEARARDAEARAERLEEHCASLVERVQRATGERDECARQCAMVTSQLDLFESALGDRLYGAE